MSDILIKNMEIPKDSKYVDVRIFRDGTATTSTAEEPFYKRMAVIEVPPHGDLIDRDELDDWFYATPIFTRDENADVWKVIRLDDIDNAPTIINAERRFYAL